MIQLVFKYNGIILGGLPTVLLYIFTFVLAQYLFHQWGERQKDKEYWREKIKERESDEKEEKDGVNEK